MPFDPAFIPAARVKVRLIEHESADSKKQRHVERIDCVMQMIQKQCIRIHSRIHIAVGRMSDNDTKYCETF